MGRKIEANPPSSPRAYELYLRANQILLFGLRSGEQLTAARDLYQRALKEDPGYAPAWARLGRCHWLIGKGTHASEHLERADACFKRALTLNSDLLLAHALHAQLEADLGRAPEAMVRLIGLARARPATPEVYAALVQVCRYCGQLEASIAAHERARSLDPDVPTSANHTYWQLGDAQRAFSTPASGTFILDAMILARWGRRSEAVELLRERETALPATTRAFAESLRTLLEGAREACVQATEAAIEHWPDPEGRYYLATHFAQVGLLDRAIEEIAESLRRGFTCYRLLASDPSLDPVRSMPQFGDLRARAAAAYARCCAAFADAGGQWLFGL